MRVGALWVGPPLSALEWVSLASFVMHGCEVELFTDDLHRRVPAGVRLRDATPLVGTPPLRYGPRAGIHEGSLALAANLARTTKLEREGGWWTDTDVVLLKPLTTLDSGFRVAWETQPSPAPDALVNVALMRSDAGDPLVRLLRQRILRPWLGSPWDSAPARLYGMWRLCDTMLAPGNVAFGTTGGPTAITRALHHFGRLGEVLPRETFYPVPWQAWRTIPAMSHAAFHDLAEGSYAIHLWNECYRLEGVDRERTIAEAAWAAPYLEGFEG